MTENTIAWKDYEISVDLHRSYLDFAIKLNLFYYAITGTILSFHFSKDSPPTSWVGLLLPIAFSISLGIFLLYGAKLANNLRRNIKIRAEIVGLHAYPNGIVLVLVCVIFGSIMFLTGLVLIGYILFSGIIQ